jgi:hypothetical protein
LRDWRLGDCRLRDWRSTERQVLIAATNLQSAIRQSAICNLQSVDLQSAICNLH